MSRQADLRYITMCANRFAELSKVSWTLHSLSVYVWVMLVPLAVCTLYLTNFVFVALLND